MVDFRHKGERYDVAILGSGLEVSVLADLLAQQGHSVLLLEKKTDVPFPIEECGAERTLAFLYHEEGKHQNPARSHLPVPPAAPLFAENHLGCAVDHRRIDLCELEIGNTRVVLRSRDGEEFRARFLIDGTGRDSLLASTLRLREEPAQLRTQSRSIVTQMSGLRPSGDTRHVFDGGWLQLIPFAQNGDAETSLCRVRLTLDLRKHPERGLPAEEEFREVLTRHPSLAAHLEDAQPAGPWISTGRLQYSSTRVAGDRWFLLGSAAGFVDPLYSRGLPGETVHSLAGSLVEALRHDDFRVERFTAAARLQEKLFDAEDRRVDGSYQALGHVPLWNAWVRLWLHSTLLESLAEDLLDAGEALLAAVEEGLISADEAAQRIFEHLDVAPLLPVHEWSDSPEQHLFFTPREELAAALA